ncbi:protein DMP7 [Mercurialis annua]|uniref:protein DMP7 n=1 Tax=Mercurialis annua TaxID=3986 RepID=UPI00215E9A86|nr:protein DMP7 [Mercurialis annua]
MDTTPILEQPLLENPVTPIQKPSKTPTQKAIRKTFKGTTQLSKLLPTGSVLAFQILSPIFTHQGQCHTSTSTTLTLALLTTCAISCFLLCLTDSFRDERGKVRYGMATSKGLWVIDGSVTLSEDQNENYKMRFIDLLHGFASMLVFGAVALFDKNVVNCFCPTPSDEVKDLLVAVPVGVGVVCSILFLKFPTKRHGIGTPLSRH